MSKKIVAKKTGNGAGKATHWDRIKTSLSELKPNITTGDRRAARQFFGITNSTISKYLNGQVNNAEMALELLTFFSSRVTERENRLNLLSI